MIKRSFGQKTGLSIFGAALSIAALAFTTFAATGCSVHDDNGPEVVVPAGTLVLSWQLDEANNTSVCAQENATQISVSVNDSNGDNAGTYTQDCTALTTSITLAPDNYTATALLVDANGKARTTAIDINPFTIHSGVELDITIDFPANSFE